MNRYFEDRPFTIQVEYIHSTSTASFAYRPIISDSGESGLGITSSGYPMIYIIFYDYETSGGYKTITTLGRTDGVRLVDGQKYVLTLTYNGYKTSPIPARLWVNGVEQYTSPRPTTTVTQYSEFQKLTRLVSIGGQGAGQRVTVGRTTIWKTLLSDEQIANCNFDCEESSKILDLACSEGSGLTLYSTKSNLPNANFYNISDLPNTRKSNNDVIPYNLKNGFITTINSSQSGPLVPSIYDYNFKNTDVLICCAGTVAVNGLFKMTDEIFNSYPVYKMINNSDYGIKRDNTVGNRWTIFKISTSHAVYSTSETTLTTPVSPNWITRTLGTNPVPTSYKVDNICRKGYLYNSSENLYKLEDTTTDSQLYLSDTDRLLFNVDGTGKWFDINNIYYYNAGFTFIRWIDEEHKDTLVIYKTDKTYNKDINVLKYMLMSDYFIYDDNYITVDDDGHVILDI